MFSIRLTDLTLELIDQAPLTLSREVEIMAETAEVSSIALVTGGKLWTQTSVAEKAKLESNENDNYCCFEILPSEGVVDERQIERCGCHSIPYGKQ